MFFFHVAGSVRLMAFKARRLTRLRVKSAAEAWAELRDSDEAEQVATWLEVFQRTFDPERYATALAYAEQAFTALGGVPVTEWLAARGITVATSTFPATFGTATVRAHFDPAPPRVTIFEGPLEQAARAFETCESGVTEGLLRDTIVAHEAFHVLHPDCPGKVAEVAAHLFAGRASGLGSFGGLVDVVHALSKWW